MTTMDLWYDLASRAPTELNEETTALLQDADEASRPAEPADEDDG